MFSPKLWIQVVCKMYRYGNDSSLGGSEGNWTHQHKVIPQVDSSITNYKTN